MAHALAQKLEHTGPAEKERVVSVPQREQLASTPEPPWSKGKGTESSVHLLTLSIEYFYSNFIFMGLKREKHVIYKLVWRLSYRQRFFIDCFFYVFLSIAF